MSDEVWNCGRCLLNKRECTCGWPFSYPAEGVIERPRQAREVVAENRMLRDRVATLEGGIRELWEVWMDDDATWVEVAGTLDELHTSLDVKCDGRCITPEDLGVMGTGVEVAHPDPECSLHGGNQ